MTLLCSDHPIVLLPILRDANDWLVKGRFPKSVMEYMHVFPSTKACSFSFESSENMVA